MCDACVWCDACVLCVTWKLGDVILSNHPSAGGSHLPDMTVITPVHLNGKIVFFVANRAHHADIGSISPGSMPPFSMVKTNGGEEGRVNEEEVVEEV